MARENVRYLRIEGEAVCAIEEVTHSRSTLPEWLAELKKLETTAMATPILPEGCALFAQKGAEQLVLINQPAAVKKVVWRTESYRDRAIRKTRWQLAVPAHVFLLVFRAEALKSSHLYFVPAPVASEKDVVYRTCLANIYGQNDALAIPTPICSGAIRLDVKKPLADRCQQFITAFWETEFNDDIIVVTNHRQQYHVFQGDIPKQLVNLNAWDKATTEEPDFWTKMDWPFESLCSVSEILSKRWAV